MAKRRRLTAANPAFLGAAGPMSGPTTGQSSAQTSGQTAVPMRAPIAEIARETASTAAAEELARTLTEARESGRMVLEVPLGAVQLDYLVRDRVANDAEDMAALRASIAARGQQTPVELVELAPGRYGLISGWRRMKALEALHGETGEDRFATVLGLVRRPAERADAYLAMIEENEIRVGLSYFERARIVHKAVEQGVFDDDRAALRALFAAASRAKRSKIGSFLSVVRALDGALRHPQAIGERLGLQLGRALEADEGLGARLRAALAAMPADPAGMVDPGTELACLEAAVTGATPAAARAPTGSATPSATPSATSAPEKAAPGTAASPGLPRPVNAITGILVREDADGRLILEGNRVDSALKARLIAWLREA